MAWLTEYVKEVRACEACSARKEAYYPVPGDGSDNAKVVFVGRNPGKVEDQVGLPFVGKAGDVFDRLLMEIELERSFVFVTNMCLCKTNGDRQMSRLEAKTCMKKFLIPTLEHIKPKVVVVFGAQANHFINGIPKISEYSGRVLRHKMGFLTIPSIHPAAALYKREKFKDLQKVARCLYEILVK